MQISIAYASLIWVIVVVIKIVRQFKCEIVLLILHGDCSVLSSRLMEGRFVETLRRLRPIFSLPESQCAFKTIWRHVS